MRKSEIRIIPKLCPPLSPLRPKVGGGHVPPGPMVAPPMEMVIEKLQKMRQDKAGGADELVPRLLILIKDEISYPLTVLF